MNAHADLRAKRKQIRRERDALRGRLGKGRFEFLVKEMAGAIRLAFAAGATATLFGLEGPFRAGIRADLCRQGWRWLDADTMAREMLEQAFRIVRAMRPKWEEGQLEWVIQAGSLIERTRCANCHAPLPEGHWKFCSSLCNGAFHRRIGKRRDMTEEQVSASVARWI